MKKKKKVVVIVGTTASGKTTLAVDLAYKFDGEIISADSRQVYKYMDVGTGKDLNEYYVEPRRAASVPKITKIPYHLIDVAHPNTHYDLAKWLKAAKISINDILDRERLPIVAGGTGLYSQALVDNFNLSKYGEDKKLRERLEKKNEAKLFEIFLKLDEKFARKLNNSEKNNKRRLIRYIEICKQGEKIKNIRPRRINKNNEYEFLLIGVTHPMEILRKRIYKRLIERLEKENMIEEVAGLHKNKKVSWKRLESFGLEYKFIVQCLRKKLSYDNMVEKLNIAIGQFAKKQVTWLRRWEKQGAKIHWIKNRQEIRNLCKNFLRLDN